MLEGICFNQWKLSMVSSILEDIYNIIFSHFKSLEIVQNFWTLRYLDTTPAVVSIILNGHWAYGTNSDKTEF